MKAVNKKDNNKYHFVDELASTLTNSRIKNAHKKAEKVILQIRLSELREKRGFKQEEIKSFSQSSVSKLESRKDMKISTLIEYLDNLGLGIEIKAYPKDKKKKNEDIVLLKA